LLFRRAVFFRRSIFIIFGFSVVLPDHFVVAALNVPYHSSFGRCTIGSLAPAMGGPG